MAAWVRTVWAAAVLIVPGGFLFLLAYLCTRILHQRYLRLHHASGGGSVPLKELFSELHLRDVVREARASL